MKIEPIELNIKTSDAFQLTERTFAVSIVLIWVLFTLFCVIGDEGYVLRTAFGFPLLIFTPGLLFLQLVNISPKFDWGYLGLASGASIIILMVWGLVTNYIFPLFGIVPLVEKSLFISVLSLFIFFALLLSKRNKKICILKPNISVASLLYIVIPLIFVILSIVGAIRLNNGFSGKLTLGVLFGIAAFLSVLLYKARFLKASLISSVLYLISLSLLLMTSLRGWNITGHDIQREYRVFQLTKNAGMWSVDFLQDAYNACLSITILPTMFSEILSIPDIYVYKVLFQVVFAIVPVLCFLIVRRYFDQTLALLSSIIIISFPTFFTDMPMLNRQEIAFLMFVLMLYVMFEESLNLKLKRFLILFFGVGIIFSHYSTNYIVILLFSMTFFGLWLFRVIEKISSMVKNKKITLPNRAFEMSDRPVVTFTLLLVLTVSSFVWSSLITNTSDSSIRRVVERTIDSVWYNSENSRSVDTLYSLFSIKKISDQEFLQSYIDNVVEKARSAAPAGTYFEESPMSMFQANVVKDQTMPLTLLGGKVTNFGIDVQSFNNYLKLGSAKLLQLLLLVGLLSALFNHNFFRKKFEAEYFLLAFSGIVFVAIMVLIPVLSVEYGVLRAFQQSLFITAPIIIIGALRVFFLFSNRVAYVLVSIFALTFFLSSTGAITQSLGGYKAQLHLNNSGPYYDIYYVHASERDGVDWLTDQTEYSEYSEYQSEVQTDRYLSNKIKESSELVPLNDIYPSLIRKNSFIFVGYANTTKNESTIYYNGNLLTYKYPIELLDAYKNRVYDSGDVLIFR